MGKTFKTDLALLSAAALAAMLVLGANFGVADMAALLEVIR